MAIKLKYAGGWRNITYSFRMAKRAGGILKLYRALRNPNTCKACALGMGGHSGGMIDESGNYFQVCKKSMQAQAQDMMPAIDPKVFVDNSINDLRKMSGRELESLGRLSKPLYLSDGDSHFKQLDWKNALKLLVDNWRSSSPDRSFFYTSGRSSIEAGFLIQLIARQWGTNNVNNCSYYCHQASGVGLGQSLGSGTSSINLDDLGRSDLVVLIGANPSSNHPRFMTHLVNLKNRGGKVIVINPFKELGLQKFKVPSNLSSMLFGSKIDDLYLQPHCGGDLAFFKAAAVYLWEQGAVDSDFLNKSCENQDEFRTDLESDNLTALLEKSGISYEELKNFCDLITKSEHTIFAWAMGVTHQLHGVETVQAIANLALLTGMIGKKGAGLLPLRGHSNVQGMGTVGVVPTLKPEIAKSISTAMNFAIPTTEGKDTYSCMEAAYKGEMDFALLIGGNLYGANPDSKWASEALSRIKFTSFLSTTLNLGHLYGKGKSSLLLPVLARDEEKQSTSQESMFSFVRLSSGGGTAPDKEIPSESEIISYAGRELLGNDPGPWNSLNDHEKIRNFISRTIPDLEKISKISSGNEFTIPGRVKHKPKFNTPSGKAKLIVVLPPDSRPKKDRFNLMTFRSEGQFNTIVYEEEDLFRGVNHRNVLFMNLEDIIENGFSAGETVTVENETGSMNVELVQGSIRAGNVAMYYPEANELIPGLIDPQSKTPSFKRTSVKITSLLKLKIL